MATRAAKKTAPPQVPAGPPVRVEIRVGGRIRFADNCYDIQLEQTNGQISLTAALKPTMVDAPPPRPQQKFGEDPRDGEEIIQQVHSGRRT